MLKLQSHSLFSYPGKNVSKAEMMRHHGSHGAELEEAERGSLEI